jgi:2,4-didehydro-3-deoxy-L-rhamnonate hydrolase
VKFVTFTEANAAPRVGILDGDAVVDFDFPSGTASKTMREVIAGGADAVALAHRVLGAPNARRTPPAKARLCAPVMPGKIICSGLNYRSHVEENPNAKFLDDPRFFGKAPNTVIGPGDAIRHPGEAYQVDYEVELAVVVGRTMPRATPAEQVMEHVFGYTILHDVSSRYIQFKDNNEYMGKNFDTFCPIGPCIVTADEIPDPSQLRLRTWLNGRLMQDGSNTEWCFPLPRLLAWLSQAMTLDPGDIVSTGTPAGIGWFRRPQVFLRPGDVVRLEIDGIGQLENPIVSAA